MRTYLAIAALFAGEAAVAAWAITPDVDPVYRAVYIERSSDCYPLEVTGDYTLGEQLSFTKAGGMAPIHAIARCGWREPTLQGTWSEGVESRLRFRLDAPAKDLLLTLDLAPYVREGVVQQRIRIAANDTPLDELAFDEPGLASASIRIPAHLLGPAGSFLDITLTYPDATSPAALGIGKDRCVYAIHLVALKLEAVP